MSKELKKALDAGQDDGSINQKMYGGALITHDIFNAIKPILTDDAVKVFDHMLPQTIEMLNGKVTSVVRYFGVYTSDRGTGALKLANIINELVEKYDIIKVLGRPLQIEMYDGGYASIFYPFMNPSDAILSEKENFRLAEGGVPNTYLANEKEIDEMISLGLDKLDEEKR